MAGFGGYKTAAAEQVPEATSVMDPFYAVALAGLKLDLRHQRIQQQTCGHRGRSGDRSTGSSAPCAPATRCSAPAKRPGWKQFSPTRTTSASRSGHITNFGGFGLIITPDISVGDSMSLAQRTSPTVWSRQAGVVLERHGLTVVPNVRWILPTDCDMVARGIPQRSVIAVSNYGSRRDPLLRKIFNDRLPAMIERLAPEVVLVFGSTRPRVFRSPKNRTEFIEYRPKTAPEPITRQSFRDMVPLFDIPA